MIGEEAAEKLGYGLLAGFAVFVGICAAWDLVDGFIAANGAMGRAVVMAVSTLALELLCAGACWWAWRHIK